MRLWKVPDLSPSRDNKMVLFTSQGYPIGGKCRKYFMSLFAFYGRSFGIELVFPWEMVFIPVFQLIVGVVRVL